MRELERNPPTSPASLRLSVVGAGRLGTALWRALTAEGWTVGGPHPRGYRAEGEDAVLLCVPDAEIADAAALLPDGVLVGHCSGATPLDALAPRERFGLHPLMTVTEHGATFAGAGCAVAGSSERALAAAHALAGALGMHAFELDDGDRAIYHAAASVASNFLVTLEAAAERLAATAGVPQEALAPLVLATAANWATLGGGRALTGPIARGDEETVARQRDAIAERAPDLLPVFDALAEATRHLAASGAPA
jgi:predicted short-subunit dehydrogenase-like oxidoreductase (DUF2520 family)